MTKRNVVTLILVVAVVGALTLFNTYQDPDKNWREQVERVRAEQGEVKDPMKETQTAIGEQAVAAIRLKEEADVILAQEAAKVGIVARDSGLLYRALKEGEGARPSRFSTIRVLYEGRFANGEVFDSATNAPATLNMENVIAGWQEALHLMREGAKWELIIPPALGYGFTPKPSIPAGSILYFTVELVEVVDLPAFEN